MTRKREDEALSLLGLARRAGGVVPGTGEARRSLRSGGVALLLTASDAAPTQLRKVLPLAKNRGVPRRVLADRARLGQAVGRAPISALAVTESSFAQELLNRLLPEGEEGLGSEQRR